MSLLAAGDRVALVSPAGPAPASRVEAGVAVLRSWGLEVATPVVTPWSLPYLAGSDTERAAAFVAAWCADVAAVFCVRGGYGCLRMTDLVPWKDLPPRVFVGSSDVTVLHAELNAVGLATVFGPMPGTADFVDDPLARERLREVLFTGVRSWTSGTTVVPGTARGVLTGGNAALLAASVGGPRWARPADGAIALLEDVGEEPYRLDRILTQLLRAGWFEPVSGIVLGSWTDCGDVAPVLLDRLGPLGVPILGEFGFGHCAGSWSLPLGVRAVLDATAGTLTLA
ncbi:muramoyltetrapeptide carboxypeptidase [Lentzea xinjiangensis]|uniref:Muramoyltetrapeptide carboxypeptidase n=1 Tax=Lentzea xinjiangensis TaxID=402600 RepID=A0A1H9KVA8_9PSEU|nr:LD-carboxypeptidase [Lentzea xinjiangensis]SER03132.1 muramoyltetrapeptide carboxypeptidase [Lentzea xinjiangensis]